MKVGVVSKNKSLLFQSVCYPQQKSCHLEKSGFSFNRSHAALTSISIDDADSNASTFSHMQPRQPHRK